MYQVGQPLIQEAVQFTLGFHIHGRTVLAIHSPITPDVLIGQCLGFLPLGVHGQLHVWVRNRIAVLFVVVRYGDDDSVWSAVQDVEVEIHESFYF